MSADSGALLSDAITFGPYRLSPAERLLERNDSAITIGSRALDILIALIERPGEIVSHRDLIRRVWPNMVVEEANLRVHVGALRKVLRDDDVGVRYIANIPGRGYCFVAPIRRSAMADTQPLRPAPARLSIPDHNLPPRLSRMIGRGETIAALLAMLASYRFVSVIGPGGMGKTTVAISVAHDLLSEFGNAIFFVDLASINEDALVPTAVTSVLGVRSHSPDPWPDFLAFLGRQRVLLVLDNCDHVIAGAAALTERLYSEAPNVHLLTTSRESLRVEGEHVHLLRPLEHPPHDADITTERILAAPAVQLFMERAAASGFSDPLSDDDARIVTNICRRLDGIALAIELVASRIGTYGIRGTEELLNNRFKLLWQGRRRALPRHQTLHAMLDWSQRHLLEVLEREGRVLSSELSIRWGLSEDTIRRDLREMEQGGMLQRVHGGALPRSPGALPYDARRRLDVASKSAIARRAADLISEGQTVFIDGGTTTVEIASHLLRDRRATIITNSPPLALALADHSKLDVLLLGGSLLKDARVTVGADTVREIASIRADLCLLGMCSLHPDIGITVGSVEEACVKRAMITTSAKVVGLISRAKMGTILPYVVGPTSALTQLITDVSDEVVLEPYRSQGICITALIQDSDTPRV